MRDWTLYVRERLDLPDMKKHRDERMIRELADHLEDLYTDALAQGASEEEAEAAALRELDEPAVASGDLTRSEPAHTRRRLVRWVADRESGLRQKGGIWTALLDAVRDVRLSCRALAKSPLFTAVSAVVLALGIGATTAIFTLVDAIVLSPLPFDDPDALVAVSHAAPARGFDDVGQTAAWHLTYEDENRVFEDLGMWSDGSVSVTGVGDPEAVPALFASSGVLRTLRLSPVLGRLFTSEDEQPDGPNALLLSYDYWQSRFGADPSVLGRTIRVDGSSWEVAGVLPPTLASLGVDPALVLPIRFDRSQIYVGNVGFGAVARLSPGTTLQTATADLERILPLAWEKFPGGPVSISSTADQYSPFLTPLKDDLVGSVADLLWVLLGGVGVVLLIACANVANLLLVRAEGRETEMAVRVAIGATRRRIGWEYLKESLLLGILGGAGGLLLAFAGLRALLAVAPAELPRLQHVSLSPSVLLFTAGVSVGTGLLFGLVPGLKQGRTDLASSIKQGGSSGMRGHGRNRVQSVLAASQMALALVLLVASGLMVRSVGALRNVDPGFGEPEGVLAFRLSIPATEVQDAEETALVFERVARRMTEIPGVESVGMGTTIPMDGGNNVNPFYADGVAPPGDGPPPMRRHKWVGEGFFETLRIPVLAGRTFTWDDVHARFPGAIVSESLAVAYWGSAEAAIGQRVAARPEPVRWHEVVGVVGDVRDDGVDQDPLIMVYWPQVTLGFWGGSSLDQAQTWRTMGFAIRSGRVGTPGLLAEVRDAVWDVAPNLPLRGLQPLSTLMAVSVAQTSFTLTLLGIAAGIALLLGMIGVYGVISYAVSQRTRELGMRIALGAQARDVKRFVLRRGLVLSLSGVGLGIGLALVLTRLMAGLLFGVSPTDVATLAVVAISLTGVALAASYFPARRAAAVDPIEALRAP